MKCEQCLPHIPDMLMGELNPDQTQAMTAHFMTCSQCGSEFDRVAKTWQAIGDIPEKNPSPELSKQFYAMLDGYVQGSSSQATPIPIKRKSQSPLAWQLLAAAALLIIGFLIGRPPVPADPMVVQAPRQDLSLAWMQDTSAVTRLKNISQIANREEALSPHLYSVMLFVLERDPNVDVRLAALRALGPYCTQPKIREGLVAALLQQDAPLIQIEIIELLCSNASFDSTDTLETLLQREPLNPFVKQRAQELLLENR